VTGRVLPGRWPKRLDDQVGVLDCDIEQIALPRRLEMRDGRLVQMSGIVEFVAAGVLVLPPIGSDTRCGTGRIDRPRGKQIAVGLLRFRHERNEIVQLFRQRGIRMRRQRIGRGLDDLVDVRVVEPPALIVARHQPRALAEIVHAAGLLVLLQDVRNRHRAIGLELRLPKSAGDLHRRHRDGLNWIGCHRGLPSRQDRGRSQGEVREVRFHLRLANFSPDQTSLIAHTL
jgi:hypothetical protein